LELPQNVYFYGDGDLYEIAAAYAFHIAESQAYLSLKSTASIPALCRNWPHTKRGSVWPSMNWIDPV
jgi:hypothetical protein